MQAGDLHRMEGYRFVNLNEGELGLYKVEDGALTGAPLLRGTVSELERELGLYPGTLKPPGEKRWWSLTVVEVVIFWLGALVGWLICNLVG